MHGATVIVTPTRDRERRSREVRPPLSSSRPHTDC